MKPRAVQNVTARSEGGRGAWPLVLLLSLVVLLVAAAPARASVSDLLTDVSDDYPYAAAIERLYTARVVVGFEDGSFRPEADVKRMQFTKMLVRALGDFTVTEADLCPFPDVYRGPASDFYPDNYIAVAAGDGITEGYPDGTFRPSDSIARAQAVAMVVRALRHRYPGMLPVPPASSPWAGAAAEHAADVAIAQANGLLAGLPLDVLDPWGPMKRGEVAQIMSNVLTKLWSRGPDAAEPDGTAGEARAHEVGAGWLVGSLDPGYDSDWVRFATVPGRTYRVHFVVDAFSFWGLALFSGPDGADEVASYLSGTSEPRGTVLVFEATAEETLLEMRSVDSPGGDGHSGSPAICSYHVAVEEPAVRQLRGRVADADGSHLAGVTVSATDTYGMVSTTTTASDGTYLFPSLMSGVYRVEAGGEGFLPFAYTGGAAQAAGLVDLRDGDQTGIDMALPPAATVRLRVLDERGRPLAADTALVRGDDYDDYYLPDVAGPPLSPGWPETYVFSNLPAGDYEAMVDYDPYFFADLDTSGLQFSRADPIGWSAFSLAAGETREVTLQVSALDLTDPRQLAQQILLRGFWLDYFQGGTTVFLPASLPTGWYPAPAVAGDPVRQDNPWVHRAAGGEANAPSTAPNAYDVAYTNGDSLIFVSLSTDGSVAHLPLDRSGAVETSQTDVGVPAFLGGLWDEFNPAPPWVRHAWEKTVVYAAAPPEGSRPSVIVSVCGAREDEAAILDMVRAMRCLVTS